MLNLVPSLQFNRTCYISTYLLGIASWKRELRRGHTINSLAVDDTYAREHDRFNFACFWALTARLVDHPSVVTAYKNAMSALQNSLSFSPTVSSQVSTLVSSQCEIFVGWHSTTRLIASILVSSKKRLRYKSKGDQYCGPKCVAFVPPAAQLAEEDSHMAQRFEEIDQELEALIISTTLSVLLVGESNFHRPIRSACGQSAETGRRVGRTRVTDPRPIRNGRVLEDAVIQAASTLRSAAFCDNVRSLYSLRMQAATIATRSA